MYTPRAPPVEYGGLFGTYLKKVSLARTRKEKYRDAESGCQTSTKEVSLKDHVKAMEDLCTSLMILPKEIKSLKVRVYKLETIIIDDGLKVQKLEAKNKRLAEQRRIRLAYGIPLAVEDPIQMALAYREKMVKFDFEHKIICPS
nr:phospholipase-like protein [Tanacetum cinerariifolium]